VIDASVSNEVTVIGPLTAGASLVPVTVMVSGSTAEAPLLSVIVTL
jgi:hypothetical protein